MILTQISDHRRDLISMVCDR